MGCLAEKNIFPREENHWCIYNLSKKTVCLAESLPIY